ncbi:unnamed protein product [Ilex paraguariensis]|uniref:Uncharacterized protein n=1 Tax=Ilex paraguariensis TaxID=185542 RepID=A0ABC8TS18_9AQUA
MWVRVRVKNYILRIGLRLTPQPTQVAPLQLTKLASKPKPKPTTVLFDSLEAKMDNKANDEGERDACKFFRSEDELQPMKIFENLKNFDDISFGVRSEKDYEDFRVNKGVGVEDNPGKSIMEMEKSFFDVNNIGLYTEGSDCSTNCADQASDYCKIGKDRNIDADEAICAIAIYLMQTLK